MADWYVSKTKWNAVTQWAASTTLSVGAIRRQLTGAAQYNYCCYRVSSITTGITGSTEPTWPTSNNGTVVDGGVTWTNVTGQGTYGWTAPAGDIGTLTSNITIAFRINLSGAQQDNIWIDSTQSETGLNTSTLTGFTQPFATSPARIVSVNTGGSVPPAPADYTPGASLAFSSNAYTPGATDICGVNFGVNGNLYVCDGAFVDAGVMQDWTLTFLSAGFVFLNYPINSPTSKITWRNFSANMQAGQNYLFRSYQNTGILELLDCPSLFVGGNYPNYVFNMDGNINFYSRGVDYSQITGTNYVMTIGYGQIRTFATFEECIIPVANLTNLPFSSSNGRYPGTIVQCINCDSTANNTNYNSYKQCSAGALSTSSSVYRSGGASIEGTQISWQLVGYYGAPYPSDYTLDTFNLAPYDNQTTGSSVTLYIECIGTGTAINNTDLELEMWYQGSSSSPIGSRVSSLAVINTTTAVASSAASWVGSPGGSAQRLSVTFTPQKKGVICGRLRLRSAITVYVDPVPHT